MHHIDGCVVNRGSVTCFEIMNTICDKLLQINDMTQYLLHMCFIITVYL